MLQYACIRILNKLALFRVLQNVVSCTRILLFHKLVVDHGFSRAKFRKSMLDENLKLVLQPPQIP